MSLFVWCGFISALLCQAESTGVVRIANAEPQPPKIQIRMWLVEIDDSGAISDDSVLKKHLSRAPSQAPQPPAITINMSPELQKKYEAETGRPASELLKNAQSKFEVVPISGTGSGKGTPGEVVPLDTAIVDRELKRLVDLHQVTMLSDAMVVTRLGQKVMSLNGGEFPVPLPEGGTPMEFPAQWVSYVPDVLHPLIPAKKTRQVNVELHKFGTRVEATPTRLDAEKVRVRFLMDHSTPDKKADVKMNGINVPGLSIRSFSMTADIPFGLPFLVTLPSGPNGVLALFVAADPVGE